MITAEQVLRVSPAALGDLTAALRALPTAANSVRRGRGHDVDDAKTLRVLALQAPPA